MASSGWQGEVTLVDQGFGYDWFKGDLRVDSITHSGSTVTVSGVLAVKNTRSGSGYSYYIDPINARAAGGAYQQIVAGNQHINDGSMVSKSVTFTFSAGASETSKQVTVDWLYYGGGRSNSKTYTLYFDADATAPTGLDVTGVTVGAQSIKATVSVTGWGGAGDASSRYRELQVWSGNMSGDSRKQTATGNTLSSEITCNNSSSGTLTLTPNTKYYIGAYATNGTLNTGSQPFGTAITNVPTAGATMGTVTARSATINWSIANQGGERDIKIDYSLDSGSWTTVTTATGSGAKSGSFTLNNLTPNSSHTIVVRSSAVGGSVAGGTTLNFTMADWPTKIYCSVNNSRKRVKRIYCSVGGQRKKVKKIYCSVNGVAKLAFEDQL